MTIGVSIIDQNMSRRHAYYSFDRALSKRLKGDSGKCGGDQAVREQCNDTCADTGVSPGVAGKRIVLQRVWRTNTRLRPWYGDRERAPFEDPQGHKASPYNRI